MSRQKIYLSPTIRVAPTGFAPSFTLSSIKILPTTSHPQTHPGIVTKEMIIPRLTTFWRGAIGRSVFPVAADCGEPYSFRPTLQLLANLTLLVKILELDRSPTETSGRQAKCKVGEIRHCGRGENANNSWNRREGHKASQGVNLRRRQFSSRSQNDAIVPKEAVIQICIFRAMGKTLTMKVPHANPDSQIHPQFVKFCATQILTV